MTDDNQGPDHADLDEALRIAHQAVFDTARLTRLLSELSDPAPLALLLDRALSTLSELFSADIVMLLDPHGAGRFSPVAAVGLPEDMLHLPLSDDGEGYTFRTIDSSAPFLISEAASDPGVAPHLKLLGAQTAAWLPVRDSYSTRGALVLVRCQPRPFTTIEAGHLSSMAYRIGIALEHARAKTDLEHILQTGYELGRQLDTVAVGSQAVRVLPEFVGADAAALVLRNGEGILQCVSRFNIDRGPFSFGELLTERIFESGRISRDKPYLILDLQTEAARLFLELPKDSQVKTVLAMPIRLQDELQGILYALRFSNIPFSPASIKIALLYCSQVSAALENAKLYQALSEELAERKRAEEEREKLQAQLSQAQKMESVGRLAGGVAHDFNNMLGVIIGNAELALMDTDTTQTTYSNIQEILKASHRSANLVQQLLAFARKQTIAPKVLDVNQTVESMLQMLRRLIGEDIELRWRPGADLWPIRMDPNQIDQILANLCVNARDAIEGVGEIIIETRNASLDSSGCMEHAGAYPGDYVLLAVRDNGQGMKQEVLANLFEPFFTTKGLGKGTGLGLATIYGIVKQNNGFIDVESEPGRGATFRIHLPRIEVQVQGEKSPQRCKTDLKGNETVLMVEDEAPLLNLCKITLEHFGYRVVTASDPATALDLAKDYPGPIDLVIADVVMPGMSGKEFSERLGGFREGFKLMFISGYTHDIIAERGSLGQGVNFLQKPFSIEALVKKVREVLQD